MFSTRLVPLSFKKILVAGTGIFELALARALEQSNLSRRLVGPPLRKSDGQGGTAGIVLGPSAMHLLRQKGLEESINHCAYPLNKIVFTDPVGRVLSQHQFPDQCVTLSRSRLRSVLHDSLSGESTAQPMRVSRMVHQEHRGILVDFDGAGAPLKGHFDVVIGSDIMPTSPYPSHDAGVTSWRWICTVPGHNVVPTYMLGPRQIFSVWPMGDDIECRVHVADPGKMIGPSTHHGRMLTEYFAGWRGVAEAMLSPLLLPHNTFIETTRPQFPLPFSRMSGRFISVGNPFCPILPEIADPALQEAEAMSALLQAFPVEDALHHYQGIKEERTQQEATSIALKKLAGASSAAPASWQGEDPLGLAEQTNQSTLDFLAVVLRYIEKHQAERPSMNRAS